MKYSDSTKRYNSDPTNRNGVEKEEVIEFPYRWESIVSGLILIGVSLAPLAWVGLYFYQGW